MKNEKGAREEKQLLNLENLMSSNHIPHKSYDCYTIYILFSDEIYGNKNCENVKLIFQAYFLFEYLETNLRFINSHQYFWMASLCHCKKFYHNLFIGFF